MTTRTSFATGKPSGFRRFLQRTPTFVRGMKLPLARKASEVAKTTTPDLKRNSMGEFILPSGPANNEGTKQERLMNELIATPGVAQKMVVVLKTEGMVLMPWLNQVLACSKLGIRGRKTET